MSVGRRFQSRRTVCKWASEGRNSFVSLPKASSKEERRNGATHPHILVCKWGSGWLHLHTSAAYANEPSFITECLCLLSGPFIGFDSADFVASIDVDWLATHRLIDTRSILDYLGIWWHGHVFCWLHHQRLDLDMQMSRCYRRRPMLSTTYQVITFSRVVPSFTGFSLSWSAPCLVWLSPRFTEFYWVLPSFTWLLGSYRDWFGSFHRVRVELNSTWIY